MLHDIDRILTAVGLDLVPADLDRHALKQSLEGSIGHYWAAVERQSDRPRRDRIKHYNQIEKAARHLGDLLRSLPREPSSVLKLEREYLPAQMEDMADRCDTLVYDLEWEIKWGPDWREEMQAGRPPKITTDLYRRRSPIEWLAGVYLPRDYKVHLRRQPSTTRNGPYVRFVAQVCREYAISKDGRQFQPETITRALTDVRAGRVRRWADT
jgi:hypothetical protein